MGDGIAVRVKILVQGQRIVEFPEERIHTIEPSRRPNALPYFKATLGLERQGRALNDREHASRCFLQQNPVNQFLQVRGPGHDSPSGRKGCLLGAGSLPRILVRQACWPAWITELSENNLRRCLRRSYQMVRSSAPTTRAPSISDTCLAFLPGQGPVPTHRTERETSASPAALVAG